MNEKHQLTTQWEKRVLQDNGMIGELRECFMISGGSQTTGFHVNQRFGPALLPVCYRDNTVD